MPLHPWGLAMAMQRDRMNLHHHGCELRVTHKFSVRSTEIFFFLRSCCGFFLINFFPCEIFIALCGLSLVVGNRGYSSLQCVGFSLLWLLLWQSTGSRHTGSVVVVHGLSCSATCGIFPDQGSNPCPLHWQADSYPLCHQGSTTQRCF